MILTNKAKSAIRDLCSDVFLKIIREEYPDTLDSPPDNWAIVDKNRWDLWSDVTYGLEKEIIKRIES